jgi:transcriptional regulator with XRE-family HTH domain
VATCHVAVHKPAPIGMANGATNTHVRQQIKRLRLAKGWTQHDLAKAAGIAASSLGCLETGFYRFNLDTLQKIIDALGVEIADVWPSTKRSNPVESNRPLRRAVDPINFFRLSEVHSLTRAEASCIFASNGHTGLTLKAAEQTPKPSLRALYTIHLDEDERSRLSRQILQGTVTAPWVAYFQRENGRSLFVCLKNPSLEAWVEELIERYLSAWLTALPL